MVAGNFFQDLYSILLCHFCDLNKEGLPFHCNYCGESFCSDHRLPENHACPRVGGPKQPGHSLSRFRSDYKERAGDPFIRSGRARFRYRYTGIFSKIEEKHILAASFLVVISGLLTNWMLTPTYPLVNPSLSFFAIAIPSYLFSFLGHEIAHKFLARRNGLWAEFHTTLYGLLLTAVSSVFLVKFLVPGQIQIRGNGSKDALGAISLGGPGFNIVIAVFLIFASRLLGHYIGLIFVEIAWFNAWMAAINLVPLGTLDGANVYRWDKMRWAIAIAASIFLVGLSSYYFSRT